MFVNLLLKINNWFISIWLASLTTAISTIIDREFKPQIQLFLKDHMDLTYWVLIIFLCLCTILICNYISHLPKYKSYLGYKFTKEGYPICPRCCHSMIPIERISSLENNLVSYIECINCKNSVCIRDGNNKTLSALRVCQSMGYQLPSKDLHLHQDQP